MLPGFASSAVSPGGLRESLAEPPPGGRPAPTQCLSGNLLVCSRRGVACPWVKGER